MDTYTLRDGVLRIDVGVDDGELLQQGIAYLEKIAPYVRRFSPGLAAEVDTFTKEAKGSTELTDLKRAVDYLWILKELSEISCDHENERKLYNEIDGLCGEIGAELADSEEYDYDDDGEEE